MTIPNNESANQSEHYDAVIVGGGHNGLAAATVLAKNGLSVLVLEKNGYLGGMAATREILKGCQNEVGASCLFPLSREIKAYFDFENHGVELIPLPVMCVNLVGVNSRPLIFYKSQAKTAFNVMKTFGFSAMLGLTRLMAFCRYPAQVLDRFTARRAPRNLEDLIASAPNRKAREQLELAFRGSAMDIIDRFLPDEEKHMELRANMAFAAVQATYKGPYDKGTGLCLIYTMAQEGSEGLMQRVTGGMGKLSESLARQIESHGGEIRLKRQVQRILVKDGKAVGVELKSGEQILADIVISNLDKPATFNGLLAGEALEDKYRHKVDGARHSGAFVHMLFKLKGLPDFAPVLGRLNRIEGARFGGAMVVEPRLMQECYEACLRGELPPKMPLAYQIPTVRDSSLAPEGYHIASAYGFYFPCAAEKSERGKLRDRAAELVIDHISEHMPNFRELIVDQAIFSSDHFKSMHAATNGDWTHGALDPSQMMGERCLVEGTGHAAPFENLFLCGASCHPGPGVTFLPGYNCAHEVLAHLQEHADINAESPVPIEHAA